MLDVSMAEGLVVHRFENSDPGLRRWLRHMARAGTTQAVCEATGGYERLLVNRLRATGITVPVAHTLRVRAFARACGREAKTNALDIRVLARDDQVFPASDPCPSESGKEREELQQRLRRRRQRVDQRVQERNRLDKGVSPVVGRSTRRHLTWLDQEIARLDKAYQALWQRSAALRLQAARYRSVAGGGALDRSHAGGLSARMGPRMGPAGRQGLDLAGGARAVGAGPWSQTRPAGHPGRSGHRTPHAVHGGPVRDPAGRL